jgi:hypothetical protein
MVAVASADKRYGSRGSDQSTFERVAISAVSIPETGRQSQLSGVDDLI